MIDQNLQIIRGVLSAEREAGPRTNGLHEIEARKIRRNTMSHLMEAIEAELQPIRQAIKALPALPPEEPIQWAQNLLKMQSCLVMEIDTTGLDENAEICRVTLASISGVLFDDILIKPSVEIPADVTAINGITNEQVANVPNLPDVWHRRVIAGLEGHYVVSFAQDWDRQALTRAAKRHGLPPVFFLGEDLKPRLAHYYHERYGLTLADVAERMTGQPLPKPATAIDRVKAQCTIIAGMAEAVTDVRLHKPEAPASSADDSDERPF